MKSDEILAQFVCRASNGTPFSEICPKGHDEYKFECVAKDCKSCLTDWAREKAREDETK